jgi:hypothetical protein
MRRSSQQSFPRGLSGLLFPPPSNILLLYSSAIPSSSLSTNRLPLPAVWIDMADKQEIVELGEIRAEDTNRDEAALARLGKKTVLKVCTGCS